MTITPYRQTPGDLMGSIPMSSPDLTDAELAAVWDVLRCGQLSAGRNLVAFEKAFAEFVGARHAIAVSNGTAALHLSIIAAGVREADLVLTSPFSFVASANCILYERAIPIFVDVETTTGNLSLPMVEDVLNNLSSGGVDALPRALRSNDPRGRVKAVLPVHVFGRPVDMASLTAIAHARDIAVVEDACEALGAQWDGRQVGTFGTCGCFGFYPNKQMTTAEGGMIVTNEDSRADLCRSLRNQGRDAADQSVNNRLGYNYRLSEIACALGLVQLSRLEELHKKRAQVARWYEERLTAIEGVACPVGPSAGARLSWFVYVVRFDDARLRTAVVEGLAEVGIPSRCYFRTIPLQPFYVERFGYRPGDFPNAEHLSDTCLALPFSSVMSEAAVDRVCASLRQALRRAV